MSESAEQNHEDDEQEIKILVDTLRKCFNAEKARYSILDHENTLFIEIEGLDELKSEEISEVAEPILDELELDFEEISLLPLKN